MASIFKTTKSPYYIAKFKAWDEKNQTFTWKQLSTKQTEKRAAEIIAKELQHDADVIYSLRGSKITRKHFESMLDELCRLAGVHDTQTNSIKIKDFIESYLSKKDNAVSLATRRTYNTHKIAFYNWLDTFKDNNPSTEWLTIERAEEYYHSHLLKDKKNSAKTAREKIRTLKRIFQQGVDRQTIKFNPFNSVQVITKGDTLDRLPFTLPEIKKIIRYLSKGDEKMKNWATAVIISIQTGARLEDAISMNTSNLKKGIITYTQHKTKKTLSIPVTNPKWLTILEKIKTSDFCPIILEEYKKTGNSRLSSEFTAHVTSAGITQKFKTFPSGKIIARKTFHSIRHTLRSAIIASGASDAQADIILGHSPGEGKTYTHSDIEGIRKTLDGVL